MKKALALTLALVMCLSLITIPATAATPTLSTDKTTYQSGDEITITYSGVEIDNSKGMTWICIARPDMNLAAGIYRRLACK